MSSFVRGSINELMAKNKQSSVHLFSPPFPIKELVIVLIAAAGLLAVNIRSFQKNNTDEQTQAEQATKTLLAQVNLRNVLGSSTINTDEDAAFKKKAPAKYWYDLLAQKPDFRDAYIVLATLAYNDNRCKLAQLHLNQALTLDPNSKKNTDLAQAIAACEK